MSRHIDTQNIVRDILRDSERVLDFCISIHIYLLLACCCRSGHPLALPALTEQALEELQAQDLHCRLLQKH